MALKKCRECGNEVSTKAKRCPKCGAPVKRNLTPIEMGGIAIFVIMVVIIGTFRDDKPAQSKVEKVTVEKPVQREEKKPIKNNGRYLTKAYHLAATSEDLLDKAIAIRSQNDEDAFAKIVAKEYPYLFIMKGGDEVYLERFTDKGYVKVRPKGQTESIYMQFSALEDTK